MAIVRFKKSKGSYRKQSSFNISNEKQARQIAEVFERWYPKMQAATAAIDERGKRRHPGMTTRSTTRSSITTLRRQKRFFAKIISDDPR